MALNIKDPETDRLARNLARITGESLTETINKALRARLEQEMRRRGKPPIDRTKVDEIVKHIASRPVLDDRSPEEIIGYDEHGLPR
jgi:antitoxin VapB